MSRHPQSPDQRLDAEERALAALLPRPPGRGEPGQELDARILAAARTATHPQPAVRRPHRSWTGPAALAASLVLAMGLAWQLRPPPAPELPAQAEEAAAAGAEATAVSAIEAPPAPAEVPAAAMDTPMVQAAPDPAPPRSPAVAEKQVTAPATPAATMEMAAAPPPPPAPPAPPAAVVADAAVVMPQAAEPARAAVMAKSRESEAVRQRASAAGNVATQAEDAAQRAAAEAGTLDTAGIEEPDEDVPPATADSPDVRDAWLRRIGELLKQGKTEDAKASLAEFKRRYPDAILPPELRKLEP